MNHRILITDNGLGDSALEIDILSNAFAAEVTVAYCVTEADVITAAHACDPAAIIVQWAPITASVLDAAPNCRVISRFGIGIDMIDLDAAAVRGVVVRNVPHYCTEEVATHAVAMALALWRRLPQLDTEVRGGQWNAAAWAGQVTRLSDATVGLIGLGRIGLLVAKAFEVWGARIVVVDPVQGDDHFERVSLDELLATAHIISLHAPLMASTHHMIGTAAIATMRHTPIIVNTSRGALIDPLALGDGLRSGAIAAAGLDVFEAEPLDALDPVRMMPNVLLSPHAAWCSSAALPALRRQAALNVVEVLSHPS